MFFKTVTSGLITGHPDKSFSRRACSAVSRDAKDRATADHSVTCELLHMLWLLLPASPSRPGSWLCWPPLALTYAFSLQLPSRTADGRTYSSYSNHQRKEVLNAAAQ